MKNQTVTLLLVLISCGFGYPHGNEHDSPSQLTGEEADDREASQQTFYPSFSPFQPPPLGHSRPFFFQQEGAYSQRPQAGYQQQQLSYDSPRFSGYKEPNFQRAAANDETRGLLGSGNFGVIRGGTFYEKDTESSNYERDYSPFFRNGHGRPSYFGKVPNPKPYQHEQFANFRDFADINAPSNPAYSEFVVVYANRNDTKKAEIHKKPKNIIESLALLDVEAEVPKKKLSKSKAKLAKLLPEKKYKIKKNPKEKKILHEQHEPLLALS